MSKLRELIEKHTSWVFNEYGEFVMDKDILYEIIGEACKEQRKICCMIPSKFFADGINPHKEAILNAPQPEIGIDK